ncbi:S41 family peptidase [Parapedobacter koreensis]|nr:S41 family peptidase [Parapedobacter koreensis]
MNLQKIDKIDKYEFSFKLKGVFAELGDRHFWLEYIGECENENKYHLPFSLAPWKDSAAIALVKKNKIAYSFFLKNFPFLTRINSQKIKEFIDQNDLENKYAPKFSKQTLGVEKLNEFYKIKQGLNVDDQMKFTFTSWDFKSDTVLFLNLVKSRNKWQDIDSYLSFDKDDDRIKKMLFRRYKDRIAYIKVPEMYSYLKDKEYFQWLKQILDIARTTNALIIDIRNNRGGNRDLIDFFSDYLIAPKKFRVANLARYRGEISDDTKKDLNSRKLFPYSYFKDPESKQAIDSYMENFHPLVETSETLYSEYHYMVINSKKNTDSYYYGNPVYILTNEMTFSAASVFASSFKGLKNVKIAGICADGSSGMSKTYELKNSEIKVTFSHMLSYQKNGELFDGIGISPDIEIHRSINQILGYEDHQLETLLENINRHSSIEN